MIKVSVIVPVYNAEKYLRQCMDSLVNQTLRDIEIIAVNDGSKDGSLAILREYEAAYPEKVRVFTKENGGQASARNLALQYAVGEYIGYVDADDYADTDMFRTMAEEAEKYSCDAVACDSYTVNGEKTTYTAFGDYPEQRNLFLDAWVSPCNKMIRREIYIKSSVVFHEGYIYEDTAWFAEMIPWIKTIRTVHRPLYYRLVNENSTMTSAQGKRTAQIFPVMNGVVDYYKEHHLLGTYRNELEYFYIRILFLSSMRRISRIEDAALRNEYIRQTLFEVNEHFPNYRKNQYLHGWKGLYIRLSCRPLLHIMVLFARILDKG